jgi:very-short-patch-repair endonuclease
MLFSERPDVTLARVAAGQAGVFSRAQAIAAGLTRHQIRQRVRDGMWEVELPAVYRFTAAAADERARLWAAVLWAGPDGVASHRSAARQWDLELSAPKRPEVIISARRAVRSPLVVVHRTTTLAPGDIQFHRGLLVTSPARTIIDLAAVLRPEDLEVAFESARRLRLLTVSTVRDRFEVLRGTGRAGSTVLAEMLDGADGQAPADSRLEVKLARLLRAHGMPSPVRQYEVLAHGRWYHLDFAWPARRVVVETDGRGRHANRTAFQRDRARWSALAAQGWRVLVVTWADVTRRPEHVLAQIADALT